eukprot:1225122-Karenia_brevis.AAC.1
MSSAIQSLHPRSHPHSVAWDGPCWRPSPRIAAGISLQLHFLKSPKRPRHHVSTGRLVLLQL